MQHISRFALWIFILSLAACGGSGAADKTRPSEDSWVGKTTAAELPSKDKAESAAQDADSLRISSVNITPDKLFANVDINAEVIVTPPLPDGVEFEYRWYISNQQVDDASGPVLKSGNFRKKQWILCEARAIAGEKTSNWLKSDFVRIANSPPQVEPLAVEGANVPGRFSCQLKATDSDNDELTYKLLAPLDMGIELDTKTGLLTWDLDKEVVEKMGDAVEISLSVSDNDAQPTTGSITLHFQKKTAKKTP